MKKLMFFILIIFLSINVFAEGEATIKNIKVNQISCACSGYDCEVEVDADKATITYEVVDPDATVDRNSGFSVDLISQTTSIKIVVTNNKGEEKIENTYNLTINRHVKSDDFTLKKLKVNDKDITLMKDVYSYSYEAEYSDEIIEIEATPNDAKAKVQMEKEYEFSLDRSSTYIEFTVTSESGESKTYSIVVKRGIKPDTTLKSLKIDKIDFEFKKDVLDYTLSVPYSVNDLLIEAIQSDDNASVKIEKEALVVGENKIKIIVTNDKATSEYNLLITREPNLDKSLANLKNLKIEEYSNLNFEENVLDYTLKFNEVPKELTIKATPISSDGRVEISGNEDLADGSKVIVKVILNETGVTREYTLNIEENKGVTSNKTFILVSIILLLITIIILIILEIKDKKHKRYIKLNHLKEMKKKKIQKETKNKKENKEEDLEII